MIFEQAMEMDIISKDYSKFIKLPKHKAKIVRKIFTEEEISLLWDNIKELRYADVILILIYTGMRVNELLKLPKSKCGFDKKHNYWRKQDRSRKKPYNSDTSKNTSTCN